MRETYISPFFSLGAGEEQGALEERLSALKEQGIYSVTVEYQNSGEKQQEGGANDGGFGAGAFAALDRLACACKKLGMQFWIQDAAPFPTGNAAGALRKPENEHLRKQYLGERHMDVTGPCPEAGIPMGKLFRGVSLSELFGPEGKNLGQNLGARKPLCVAAWRFGYDSLLEEGSGRLLWTAGEGQDTVLYWDIPEGQWRIFGIYVTTEGGGRPDYVNLLDWESVRLQIDNVHAPIYAHLKENLGKTWAGFFYDELEIGNCPGYDFFMLPGGRSREGGGNQISVLPWSQELQEALLGDTGESGGYSLPGEASEDRGNRLRGKAGEKGRIRREELPLLWYDGTGGHGAVRYRYMDALTRLAGEAYNGQVHSWCRERGIPYTGHVLEDENSHARLGCGPGHYFRIQKHQDMAGVDMIGGQMMPMNDCRTTVYGYLNSDGRFYHYGLAKLASSAAHIDPRKEGRSLCEVFALYGSVCSVRLRKFVIDHLLVNGINHLIYADAGERGTPVRWMKLLDDYANVMCELLNRTKAVIRTAVLYHGEAEWSGEFQYFHEPAARLARHQISYDVIPADVFADREWHRTQTKEGLCVNGNPYQALVIPYCRYLPESVAEFVRECKETGFPVFFVDGPPEGICGQPGDRERGENSGEASAAWCPCSIIPESVKWHQGAAEAAIRIFTVNLEELAEAVGEVISSDFKASGEFPWLRYSHFAGLEGDYYFLHNEDRERRLEFTAEFLTQGSRAFLADPVSGRAFPLEAECTEQGMRMELIMEPFEAQLFFFGQELPGWLHEEKRIDTFYRAEGREAIPHENAWDITLWKGEEEIIHLEKNGLVNINGKGFFPDFAGRIRYRSEVEFEDSLPGVLELGRVYEACDVYCNGQYAGSCIGAPYRVEVKGLMHPGRNEIVVEVQNSAAHDESGEDMPISLISGTAHTFLEPGGLLGPVGYRVC